MRAKSVALTAHAVAAAESELSAGPGSSWRHRARPDGGGGISLSAIPMRGASAARCSSMRRVIPDFREPDILRLGMPPLTTRSGTWPRRSRAPDAWSRTGLHLGYDRDGRGLPSVTYYRPQIAAVLGHGE